MDDQYAWTRASIRARARGVLVIPLGGSDGYYRYAVGSTTSRDTSYTVRLQLDAESTTVLCD